MILVYYHRFDCNQTSSQCIHRYLVGEEKWKNQSRLYFSTYSHNLPSSVKTYRVCRLAKRLDHTQKIIYQYKPTNKQRKHKCIILKKQLMQDTVSKCWRRRVSLSPIGSFGNDDGDAVDNVGYKMNSYFTYESRHPLKSFSLFLTVRTMSKLNMEHCVKLDI